MQRAIFDISVITFLSTRINEYWPITWEDWKLFNDANTLKSDELRSLDLKLQMFKRHCLDISRLACQVGRGQLSVKYIKEVELE